MPKRQKQPSSDPSVAAHAILRAITGDEDDTRSPAAVALGKLGGKKGGTARAKALTPERRKEIAAKAAQARWSKEPPKR